jgi:hypothetical protein
VHPLPLPIRRHLFAFVSLLAGIGACGGRDDSHAAPVVVTLGSQGNEPNGLAVSGGEVYWASVDWQAGPAGQGTVQRVSTGGGPVTVLGTGNLPYGVAADGMSVYWTDHNPMVLNSMDILRTPSAGGQTATLTTGQNIVTGIVIDRASVYWVVRSATPPSMPSAPGGGAVMKMPLGGGSPVMLATVPFDNLACAAGCIAVDAASVYWGANGAVMKVSTNGGSPITLAPATSPMSIAVAPTGVYWTDGRKVFRVGLDGGTVTTVASYPSAWTTGSVAADGISVYWSVLTEAAALSLAKVSAAGGDPSTFVTLPSGSLPPTQLAVDDTSVYMAIETKGCGGTGCATVQKVTPK